LETGQATAATADMLYFVCSFHRTTSTWHILASKAKGVTF